MNGSGPVGLGSFLAEVNSLEQDTQYFYRGYTGKLRGEKWAPNIETFLAMDLLSLNILWMVWFCGWMPKMWMGMVIQILIQMVCPAPLD